MKTLKNKFQDVSHYIVLAAFVLFMTVGIAAATGVNLMNLRLLF